MSRRSVNAGNHGRGSHWIRDEKRRRIYERDGWRCVWCDGAVTAGKDWGEQVRRIANGEIDEVRLACLDHVLPRTRGGSNEAGNLVTSCCECNEARGDSSAIEYAYDLAWADIASGDPSGPRRSATRAAEVLDRVIEAMGRELPPAVRKPAKAA